MSHLLALPRELRDNIIERTVLCRRTAPQNINELATTHHQSIQDVTVFIARKKMPFLNFTNTLKPHIHSMKLLLTCKKLNSETKEVIQRLWKHGLEYEIEAKYVQRSAWFLAWSHVPKLECCINRLSVPVQMIRGPRQTPFTYTWGSTSGLEHLVPLLFTMLRGLHCSGKAIWVEHLEIDFFVAKEDEVSPPNSATLDQWSTSPGLVHNQHPILGTSKVLEPEAVCSLLRKDFEAALADVNVSNLERSLKLAWFGDVTLRAEGVKMDTIDVRMTLASRR